jgi:hypothetical protein
LPAAPIVPPTAAVGVESRPATMDMFAIVALPASLPPSAAGIALAACASRVPTESAGQSAQKPGSAFRSRQPAAQPGALSAAAHSHKPATRSRRDASRACHEVDE